MGPHRSIQLVGASIALALVSCSTKIIPGSANDASSPAIDARRTDGSIATIDGTIASIDGSIASIDGTTASIDGSTPAARDPLQQPFASTSIWNMPVGSDAVYVPANINAYPGNNAVAAVPYADPDQIILTPTAPQTAIEYSSAAWTGADRCAPTSTTVLATAPIPTDFILPSSGENNSTAILAADGHTIVQVQPLARCTSGGTPTSLVRAPDVDLYTDGILGAHGGSGLSSIGGTIRLGELRPGQTGPAHALKFVYYMQEAFPVTSTHTCFRWPAVACDGNAVGNYGTSPESRNTTNSAMLMGALLALPTSVDITSLNLQSEPGKQMAWTLQNYGAYIVDSTGGASYAFATEHSPTGDFLDQFMSDYGYGFQQAANSHQDFTNDMQIILPLLNIVDNNGPTSIGGGGTPLQPLAPEIVAPT